MDGGDPCYYKGRRGWNDHGASSGWSRRQPARMTGVYLRWCAGRRGSVSDFFIALVKYGMGGVPLRWEGLGLVFNRSAL